MSCPSWAICELAWGSLACVAAQGDMLVDRTILRCGAIHVVDVSVHKPWVEGRGREGGIRVKNARKEDGVG